MLWFPRELQGQTPLHPHFHCHFIALHPQEQKKNSLEDLPWYIQSQLEPLEIEWGFLKGNHSVPVTI